MAARAALALVVAVGLGWAAAGPARAAPASLPLASADGAVAIAVNSTTGAVSSVTAHVGPATQAYAVGFVVAGLDQVAPTSVRVSSAPGPPASILVVSEYGLPNCTVRLHTTLAAAATSIHATIQASTTACSTNLTVPITSSFAWEDASRLKLWAPWDRGSIHVNYPTFDPLLPSDGHYDWWDGSYNYGSVTGRSDDMIVAPQASFLDNTTGLAVSVVLDPYDEFLELVMHTSGPAANPAGADVEEGGEEGEKGEQGHTASSSPGTPSSVTFARSQFRLGPGVQHTFQLDLIAHEDCFRPALAFSVAKYPELWNPTTDVVHEMASGLGSYSWFLGDLNASYAEMDYRVSWDLSGRFFPYMGMFLPPVQPGEVWLNDPEGTQPRANVSFASIDAYYARQQQQGFSTLSYFNVFEYGLNCHCPSNGSADRPSPGAPNSSRGDADWHDAMQYLLATMPDAVMERTWMKTSSAVRTTCYGTWQGGVVLNPREENYHSFLLAQLKRKLDNLPHFQGLVIDRSDWNRVYDLARDDGISWTPGGAAYCLKRSYKDITNDLRTMLRSRTGNKTVMLINTYGYSCLSLMAAYDGSFSEGHAISAVGLLGLTSPAIMWTYDAGECCKTPEYGDAYMQWRLYLGVFPMVPFPENDHSITPSPAANAVYRKYGPLFSAINKRVWQLQANPVRVAGNACKANAFETHGTQAKQLVYPVVLCANGTATATVQIRVPAAQIASAEALVASGSPWKPVTGTAAGPEHTEFRLAVLDGAVILRVHLH